MARGAGRQENAGAGVSRTGSDVYWPRNSKATGGFLHDGLLHILFNMWFLYAVGVGLESAVGRWRFLAIYLASLFAGSFGSLLFEPRAYTVGASGALFGLRGALIVIAHYRRISIWQSGLEVPLSINCAAVAAVAIVAAIAIAIAIAVAGSNGLTPNGLNLF